MSKSKKAEKELIKDYAVIHHELAKIYSNKSSDEYKMGGDITKSPSYKNIEKMIAELHVIKGLGKDEAREIETMFSTLHRPIFKQMVNDYLHEPTETNEIYTTVFTVGYRLLVGELSRIIASTEATDNGIVYKPDRISKKKSAKFYIRHYNSSLETGIASYIRTNGTEAMQKAIKGIKGAKVHQESAIGDLFAIGINAAAIAVGCIQKVFSLAAREVNPISFFNAVLMKSYDKKVEKFEEAAKNYELAKEAYEDYLKIPKADRKRKVESKYMKLINKYNIQMQHLRAKLDHFDERSEEEARDKREKLKEDQVLYGGDDDDMPTNSSSSSSSSGGSSSGGGAYDFDF